MLSTLKGSVTSQEGETLRAVRTQSNIPGLIWDWSWPIFLKVKQANVVFRVDNVWFELSICCSDSQSPAAVKCGAGPPLPPPGCTSPRGGSAGFPVCAAQLGVDSAAAEDLVNGLLSLCPPALDNIGNYSCIEAGTCRTEPLGWTYRSHASWHVDVCRSVGMETLGHQLEIGVLLPA